MSDLPPPPPPSGGSAAVPPSPSSASSPPIPSGPPPPPPPAAGGPARVPPPPPGSAPPLPAGAPGEPTGGPASTGGPSRGVVIGIVAVILAALGVAGFSALRDDDSSGDAPDVTVADVTIPDLTDPDLTFPDFTLPSLPDLTLPDVTFPDGPPATLAPRGSIPEPTEAPDGLGDDATLDGLAEDCYDGVMGACDDLYDESEPGSEYQRYGDTCAGRQPEGTSAYCETSFPS